MAKHPDKMSPLELRNEVYKLRHAMERLASMEAFTLPRPINEPDDNELIARIEYAESFVKGRD